MDNKSYFVVFWHMQFYMSWYIRFFIGFTFLNILYFFKYSCTNIFHRRSLYTFYLTQWAWVTHVCVSKLCHLWFRWWFVVCTAPSHYLNKCSLIVNWTDGSKLQWNFNRNSYFSLQNAFEIVVCEKAAILSLYQCVNMHGMLQHCQIDYLFVCVCWFIFPLTLYSTSLLHHTRLIPKLTHCGQGLLYLTWINVSPSKDKKTYTQLSVGWNYLPVPKLRYLYFLWLQIQYCQCTTSGSSQI